MAAGATRDEPTDGTERADDDEERSNARSAGTRARRIRPSTRTELVDFGDGDPAVGKALVQRGLGARIELREHRKANRGRRRVRQESVHERLHVGEAIARLLVEALEHDVVEPVR
jgi:hypothetical protein